MCVAWWGGANSVCVCVHVGALRFCRGVRAACAWHGGVQRVRVHAGALRFCRSIRAACAWHGGAVRTANAISCEAIYHLLPDDV